MRDYRQRHFALRDRDDGHVGNLFLLRRNAAQRCGEHGWTVIVVGCNRVRRSWVGLARKRLMRPIPRKFAIAQAGVQ